MVAAMRLRGEIEGLERAIAIAGSVSALARMIDVDHQLILYWRNRSKRGIAAEYVIMIERATGVPRHELRPDIYPAPVETAS